MELCRIRGGRSCGLRHPVIVLRKAEGFPNQIHLVLPPQVVSAALQEPVTRELVPTALGYFPAAAGHYISRREGVSEYIAILCTSGEGWVHRSGRRHTVGPDELAVLPPGRSHRYGAGRRAWTIYWCHFTGRSAADFAALAGGTDSPPV